MPVVELCSFSALDTGSLFALEVLHRMGMQFYEISTFAVLAGTYLLIFRHFHRFHYDI